MSQSSRFFKASGHPIHAIVAGHEEEILAQHGIYPPRSGHMLCPLHNDRRPSFRWDFDCKRFYCSRCGSGTVVDVVMRLYGVGFSEAIGRIRANNFQPMDPAEMAERKARQARGEENRYRLQLNKARWRWANSKPAVIAQRLRFRTTSARTPVETYLREVRGLFAGQPIPEALRYLPADCPAPRQGPDWRHRYPAMIAAFSLDPPGSPPGWAGIHGIHLTFLTPTGEKALGAESKITIGLRSQGFPIILRHPDNDLIIAEGIETAAAYWHRLAGIWAAGTADRLPPLAEVIHPYTRKVYIAVDDDDAGRSSSAELAGLIEEQGIPAYLIGPGAR